MAKKKVKSLDFGDSKKSKTQKYTVTSLKAVVPEVRKIDENIVKLQENRKLIKTMILNTVIPIKKKEEKEGRLYKTFIVESNDGEPATVLFKNAFKNIPAHNEDKMREELGEYFDDLYEVKVNISLIPTVKWDDLKKALGNKFYDFFQETHSIAHKSDFMERRAEIRDKANRRTNDVLDTYTKECQASPDLRVPLAKKKSNK